MKLFKIAKSFAKTVEAVGSIAEEIKKSSKKNSPEDVRAIEDNPYTPDSGDNTKCPYCHHLLMKPATRSAKCINCNQRYYVKNRITISQDHKFSYDFYEDMYHLIPKKELISSINKAVKDRSYTKGVNNLKWGLLNKRLLDQISSHKKVEIYRYMRRLLVEEKRSYSHIIQAAKPFLRKWVDEEYSVLTQKERNEIYNEELALFD